MVLGKGRERERERERDDDDIMNTYYCIVLD